MTPAEFKAAFPAFAAETDPTIQRQLDAAVPYFDVGRWDDFYNEGLGNFVAHQVAMEKANIAAGPLGAIVGGDSQSKTLGSFSVSKSTQLMTMFANDPFTRTIYGQRYVYLRRLVGLGALAV